MGQVRRRAAIHQADNCVHHRMRVKDVRRHGTKCKATSTDIDGHARHHPRTFRRMGITEQKATVTEAKFQLKRL